MAESLDVLLAELERFTRDTGQLLSVPVRAMSGRRVLEIGTSNGYSTLWLASAARVTGGSVTTLELSDYKVGPAD